VRVKGECPECQTIVTCEGKFVKPHNPGDPMPKKLRFAKCSGSNKPAVNFFKPAVRPMTAAEAELSRRMFG
jgi:hypothetical protein